MRRISSARVRCKGSMVWVAEPSFGMLRPRMRVYGTLREGRLLMGTFGSGMVFGHFKCDALLKRP